MDLSARSPGTAGASLTDVPHFQVTATTPGSRSSQRMMTDSLSGCVKAK